jgi:hypothetical protein
MTRQQLQEQCELGQQQLMETAYLDAIRTLSAAEQSAWDVGDYDSLARLYMPLQEARRQARQRCGEGIVCLDLIQGNVDAEQILDRIPHGQLLVAGQRSIDPAVRLRRLAAERHLYVETFLAAVYPLLGDAKVVAIVPLEDAQLPDAQPRTIDTLLRLLPPHCLIFTPEELPAGSHPGNDQTYAQVMSIWERLHAPFLAAADIEADPVRRMNSYRKVLRVDSACELAHQKLSDVAHQMTRIKK